MQRGLLLLHAEAAVRVHGGRRRAAPFRHHRQDGADVRPEAEAERLGARGHGLHACLRRSARGCGLHVAHQLGHEVAESSFVEVDR